MPRGASFLFVMLALWPMQAAAQSDRFPPAFPDKPPFSFSAEPRDEPLPSESPRRITRPSESPDPAAGSSRRNTGSPWAALGPLVLIIVLILAAARLWKRHGPRLSLGLPSEAVEILGRRPLDSRQTLHLVRIGSRLLVLGSSAAGLRTLAEITDPVEVDLLAGLCRRADEADPASSFLGLFRRQVAPTAGVEPDSEQATDRPAGEQRFAERLRQLAASRPDPEDGHAA